MKCKGCYHFHIRQEPLRDSGGGIPWDFGMAECDLYNLVVDFASHRKLNKLECVWDESGQSDSSRQGTKKALSWE